MKKKLGMTKSKTRNYVFLIKLRVSIIRDVAIIILNTNKFELRLTFTLTDSNQTFECGYQLRTLTRPGLVLGLRPDFVRF